MIAFNFNIWNILIATAVLHGILFSLIVISNKKYRSKALLYLIFTILTLCLSNLYYWFIDTKLNIEFPWLTHIYISFDLLVGAFFYLFIKSYLQKQVSKKQLALLLTPFLVSSVLQFLFYCGAINPKYSSIFNFSFEYFSIFFNAFLTILFFIEIFNYEKSNKTFSMSKVAIKTKWLKYSLVIGFSLCVLWGISLWYFGDNYIGFTKYYPLWIGISILIYWIAYSSIIHTTIFKQQLNIRKNTSSITVKSRNLVIPESDPKKKTNIDLFRKAEDLIINEKLYLNSQVSLELIANRLNISTNYLSQIINNHSNSSFPDYINTKRIELAKKILINPDFNKYTILSIAFETGFNSKSSFYQAFKKITSNTPSQYKKIYESDATP